MKQFNSFTFMTNNFRFNSFIFKANNFRFHSFTFKSNNFRFNSFTFNPNDFRFNSFSVNKIFRAFASQNQPYQNAFSSLLRGCIDTKDLEKGQRAHAHLIKTGFGQSIFIWNCLVAMYANCGNLKYARELFDKVPKRNVYSWNIIITAYAKWDAMELARELFDKMSERDCVSWNAMISGYIQCGDYREALALFRQMHGETMKLTEFSFANILSVLSELRTPKQGKQVHACIIKSGLDSNIILGNALVDMYAKCDNIENARKMFDIMCERDLVSWTVLISGYARHGHCNEALDLFAEMELASFKPSEITYASYFSACAEWGNMENACHVFDRLQERTLVSWNAMLTGYLQNKHFAEAMRLFCQMQMVDIELDHISFLGAVGASASLPAVDFGKQVHSQIIKTGFEANVFVSSAIVDMYMKCNRIWDAQQLFEKMHIQNTVSWTTMIAGYAQNGFGEEALKLFCEMQRAGVKPDEVTFTGIVNACASLAGLENGKQVHTHIVKTGFEVNVFVRSSIVDMYAKCGSIESACHIFEKMPEHNIVLWNAMITGYARHGFAVKVFELFEQMLREAMKPDDITFIGILSACSHAGLVNEGRYFFNSMSGVHCITPKADHFVHMIDLLGRSGHLDEAEDLINSIPFDPNVIMWGTLLGACRIHGNVKLGTRAALCLFELDPNNAAPYILLSNIYASSGRWDAAAKVRKLMNQRGVKKMPGCSWIVLKNQVHIFMAEDVPYSYQISRKVAGYNFCAGCNCRGSRTEDYITIARKAGYCIWT